MFHKVEEMFSSLLKAFKSRKNSNSRNRKNTRKNNRRNSRNQRQNGGVMDIGNIGTSFYYRPYTASSPDNIAQRFGDIGSGTTYVIPPSPPYQHTFQYNSHGTQGIMNPGNVTKLNDSFPTLASPPPYQHK